MINYRSIWDLGVIFPNFSPQPRNLRPFWRRVEIGAIKCPHADMLLEEHRSTRLGNKHCFSAPHSLLELDRLARAGKEIENNPVPEKSFLNL